MGVLNNLSPALKSSCRVLFGGAWREAAQILDGAKGLDPTETSNVAIRGLVGIGPSFTDASALSASIGLDLRHNLTSSGDAYAVSLNPQTVTLSGSPALYASLRARAPATMTGSTPTVATTIYVLSAPTGGTTNYAVWIDSGDVRLDGDLIFSGTTGTNDLTVTANLADALSVHDGVGDLMVFETTTGARILTLMGGVAADIVRFPVNCTTQWFGDAGTRMSCAATTTSIIETVTCATGEYETRVTANLADAWSITDGTNDLFVWITTTGSIENRSSQRLTTMDGVASGTARVVGGRCTANVSASDNVTAATSNNAFVSFAQTYSVPANTLKLGTIVKIRALVRVSDAAAGTETLTCNLLLGSTSLIATTAVDQASGGYQILEYELTVRAAPGAAAAIVGSGRWLTNTAGTIAHGSGLLTTTNFATNGALVIACQAKWSASAATTTATLDSLTVEII